MQYLYADEILLNNSSDISQKCSLRFFFLAFFEPVLDRNSKQYYYTN